MFSVRFIVALFCFKYALCLQKQLCDTTDDECFINAVIARVYPRLVAGMTGVETSDPLRVDAIIADLPTIRYELYYATLTGLMHCEFVKLENKRVSGYTLFDYAISCPVLTLQAQYELNGILDSVPVEGKGDCHIVYENYHISVSGKHEKVKDDKGKHHVNILDYTVIPDLKNGKVKNPEYTNLVFNNDDSCVNRERMLEEMTRDIVMQVFMKKLIENLKKFHHLVPTEHLHYNLEVIQEISLFFWDKPATHFQPLQLLKARINSGDLQKNAELMKPDESRRNDSTVLDPASKLRKYSGGVGKKRN